MKKLFILLLLTGFYNASSQQIHTVYFDLDIDEANTSSIAELNTWLAANNDVLIEKLYGYADSTGNNAYNIELSKRRVADVLKRLKQNKNKLSDNIEIKGFGEDFAQHPEQAKNRKVEIYYRIPVTEKKVTEPETTGLAQKIENSKTGDRLKLPNLYFYNHSDIVVPGSRPVLSELLVIMRNRPNLKIDVQGHICCQKEDQYNISEKRARAVYNFLVRNGIDKKRLSYHGFQSRRPVYPLPEKNEVERDANRRVEIEIIEN